MRPFFSLALLISIGTAQAQTTAQDIVKRVEATQKTTKDVSFRVMGSAALDSSSPQKIDFTVKSIPAQGLARLQFLAPDALADNIIVTDKKEVRQYLFLTNQITVTPLNKAASNAGFSEFDFNQLSDPSSLLSKFNIKLLDTSGSKGQRLFQLEATPKNSSGDRTRIWITEAGWRPTRVQFVSGGKILADLTISNYKLNAGLSAATLRQLPKSAQIIRQ